MGMRTWNGIVGFYVFAAVGCGDNVPAATRSDAPTADTRPSADASADSSADPNVPRRAICVVNSDDTVEVFDAAQSGDGAPLRRFGRVTSLIYPSWGVVDAVHDELFVVDAANAITVFERTADGGVEPVRRIAGSLTGLSDPWSLVIDAAHDEILVANHGSSGGFVTAYARSANGNVAPVRTLSTINSFLYPNAIAVDNVHDELVISSGTAIAVYPRLATGGLASRLISGAATGLTYAIGVEVDPAHDEIVVATGDKSIAVFARTATGNVAPVRSIKGASTGLDATVGVAIVNDELIVSDRINISTFPRTASGNVAPTRLISNAGASGLTVDAANHEIAANTVTGIEVFAQTATGDVPPLRSVSDNASQLYSARGVAFDPVHDELMVGSPLANALAVFDLSSSRGAPLRLVTGPKFPAAVDFDAVHDELVAVNYAQVSPAPYASAVTYPRTATGAATPLREVTPANSANFSNQYGGVAIDVAHDEILVANLASAPSVAAFARTANANAAPLRTITLDGDSLYGVAVDAVHDELFVVDAGGATQPMIRVYGRGVTGNAPTVRTIGPLASDMSPRGIALDVANDELFVASFSRNSISVYARSAAGPVAPLRTIEGAATKLMGPTSVAVCQVR